MSLLVGQFSAIRRKEVRYVEIQVALFFEMRTGKHKLLAAGRDLMEHLAVARGKFNYTSEIRQRGCVRIRCHKSHGKKFGKQYVIAVARDLGHSGFDSRPKVIEATPRDRKLTNGNFCRTHRILRDLVFRMTFQPGLRDLV